MIRIVIFTFKHDKITSLSEFFPIEHVISYLTAFGGTTSENFREHKIFLPHTCAYVDDEQSQVNIVALKSRNCYINSEKIVIQFV